VWVGYDNAEGTRRTLGQGSTGASVALPIFETIVRAAWANGIHKAPLAPPSRQARPLIADLPIDLGSGQRLAHAVGGRVFIEHFRLDPKGALVERKVTSREDDKRAEKLARENRLGIAPPPWPYQALTPAQNAVVQCPLCNASSW
jgi:membrane carboxypeptidase/penicillin-binding protein